ncbi:MAG: ATP-binding protein [Acidobacteria bacterium]|nr:ATP-binding protein [Acidobacteriota bacterium]
MSGLLWEILNAVVWTFGLRAALELRQEFGPRARTWTALVWAVVNCLVMDLAMIGHQVTAHPFFALISVVTGALSALLMALMVRHLLEDLRTGVTAIVHWPWDRIGIVAAGITALVALAVASAPGVAFSIIAVLHPLEGALWLLGSTAGMIVLVTRRYSPVDAHIFRPSMLALAFAAAFLHASLTPLALLTGVTWPDGLGSLAGTLFILTMVTTLYGTLLRVRGARLTEAERQVREGQEQLFSVEKLVAVGTLAAGAAHDFNNSLTIISGAAQLALDDSGVQGQARADIETVLQAAMDASRVTANLLQLARRRAPGPQASGLRSAVLAPLTTIERDLGKRHIRVVADCADVPAPDVDAGMVSQVCLNLYLNARDAMETTHGGTLTVTMRPADSAVEISVTDTGTGIPAWFIPRMFQPLQSTKGDKGTGLGLAGSRAMLHAAGGTLTFATKEGKGTTFVIRLPLLGLPADAA